jgi:class 3 adenylate cyclase
VDAPQVHYAKSGDVHIAYQVIGSGAVDLAFIPGLFSNLDHNWEEPGFAAFLHRLAAFSRLIVVDPRGTGLSDRAQRHPPMEEQVDDLLSVLDAAGSRSAAFFGFSQAGPIALLFAATHPERTRALVLYATYATPVWHEDYPWGRSPEWLDEFDRRIEREWGTGFFLPQIAPSRVDDPAFRTWWARMERLSCGPGNAQAYYRVYSRIDLRSILPSIRVPTLVLQRDADVFRDPGHSQYLADHIPGARLVGLSGVDHLPYVGGADAILEEVQEFLTGVRTLPDHDRVLATVLFTDIVGSTDLASVLGDRKWKELLERHHELTRQALGAFRGVEIGTTGDGFLATFDGPARAIRCAEAIVDAVRGIGLEVRAGIHTGEIELMGDEVGGIAVHIGARVASMAGPSQVLVSGTVKDLVAGSGVEFEDRGSHALKGVPGRWRLFAVRRQSSGGRSRTAEVAQDAAE